MTKTKRALVLSVLFMIGCLSMLIGTTFAWFTHSKTVDVNQIKAGNLAVKLEMQDVDSNWVDAEGSTLKWVASDKRESIIWEPGCTYQTQAFRVVNDGSLAFKYKIAISGIDGNEKLLECISFSFNYNDEEINAESVEKHLAASEKSEIWHIVAKMDTKAGNEYQGLSIDGIAITVSAIQDTVEQDSNNNQYDAEVLYDGEITTAEELAKCIDIIAENSGHFAQEKINGQWINKTVYYNAIIILAKDLDMTGVDWSKNLVINTYSNIVIDGNGHSIKNLTVEGGLFGAIKIGYQSSLIIKNLTIDNATVTSVDYGGGVIAAGAFAARGGATRYVNCKVINSNITSDKYAGGFVGYDSTGGVTPLTTKNCVVENTTVTSINNAEGGSASAGGFCGYTQSLQYHYGLDIRDDVVVTVTASRCYAGRYYGTLNNTVTLKNCVQQGMADDQLIGRTASGGFERN